jgi:hypothetical protein
MTRTDPTQLKVIKSEEKAYLIIFNFNDLVFSQTEIILKPIILSSRTGNSRVIAIAINCLQKLVIFKAFPRECIGNVFNVLESAAEMNSSDIQLKALQCLSPLMANYDDLYGSELVKVLFNPNVL